MGNREASSKTESLSKEILKEKDLQKRMKIFQKMSVDELILFKLCCKKKIEDNEIYKIVSAPVSIILSVFLQLVWLTDWGNRRAIFCAIGLIVYFVIMAGVGAVILYQYRQAEKSKEILDVIEELEKYGKMRKQEE
ncbi:MAG: hypothetical protein NC517_05540 [Firmicutes bacterium]|nr:hypothetical protein [Bacillota bacterium]